MNDDARSISAPSRQRPQPVSDIEPNALEAHAFEVSDSPLVGNVQAENLRDTKLCALQKENEEKMQSNPF